MSESGLAQLIGSSVESFQENPQLVLCLVYLVAAVMTELISNNAVAALLTPIAISVAIGMDVDPRPFVVAVMFGSSASFSTPIGYQTNTFVYGAGGYKFGDFFKAGFPLAVIMWLIASYMIPLIWPF
jgi:di/tricarboxylate transporter